jgi:hypothetical protein
MIYDFVNLCAGVPANSVDPDGSKTIEYLMRCRKIARIIISNDPSSLGLSPAVYFYSWTGKQQPILFLTLAAIIIKLEQSKAFPEFIKCRKEFEAFLIANRTLINQVIRKFWTKTSGKNHLTAFYADVLQFINVGGKSNDVANYLSEKREYSYLQPDEMPYDGVSPTRYSTPVKSGLVVQELLPAAMRCPICSGVIPSQAISIDHKQRKEDGGVASEENAQITHPYCNTGYKEWLAS